MGFKRLIRQMPLRVAAGAYILNSGMAKFRADEEHAKSLHAMTTTAYPIASDVAPQQFVKALSVGEMVLGGALLVPVIPGAVVGLALSGFSGGLVGLYVRTPWAHQEGSMRPSQQGTALAKDVWLLAIGMSLVLDGLLGEKRTKRTKRVKLARA